MSRSINWNEWTEDDDDDDGGDRIHVIFQTYHHRTFRMNGEAGRLCPFGLSVHRQLNQELYNKMCL